ncbi:MAG TPA: DUF2612 domain-containing protein [Acidobacteriaceae bacterium]|jgi:hypothetical protein
MAETNEGFGLGGFGQGPFGGEPVENLPIPYYTGLITSEYQGSTKFQQWMKALLQPLDDASQCLASVTLAFDLDQAVGVQLDVLGQIVGQGRAMTFQPSSGASPILDDTTYRLLLKARVAWNQWDGTIDGLQTVWKNLFPNGSISIEDGQNMSATVILTGAFTSLEQDLVNNGLIVPRPEGVLYNITFSSLPILGFGPTTAVIAGFGVGKFA